jgi:multiple sugar transport system substrate-binding protein
MFKNKKILAMLLVLVFGATVITGCNSSKSVKNEVVTVKFSYPPYGYDSKAEDAYWSKYITQFEKENPNIKIGLTVESWDNVITKWDEYWSTKDTPDIGYCDGTDAVEYGLAGKVLPITDVVKALGGPDKFSEDCKAFQQDGVYYSVPNCIACPVLAYRTDLLAAAGYKEPPKTWDELMTMSKALTKNGVYGLSMFTGENIMTQQHVAGFMRAAGGKFFDEKGNLVIDSPENLKALTYMTDLINAGVVPPSANTWKYGDDVNLLGTGKVAMALIWGGYGTLLESMFPQDYQKIAFTTIPVGPSGESGTKTGSGGFFLFNGSKHPEEAKAFIKFMSREEISKEWSKISGNVSPFKSVASDPELTSMGWYKAVAEQCKTAVSYGYDYGYVPGMDSITGSYRISKAVVDVVKNGMTPADSLKALQKDTAAAIESAKNNKK